MDLPPHTELLDAIVSRTDIQIIVSRQDGLIVFVNNAYADRRETTSDELIGKSVFDTGIWPQDETREAWINQIIRDGFAQRRFDFVLPDGTPGASTLFSQLLVFGGENYIVSYNIDVSLVLRIEQEREEAIERLNRAQQIAKIGDFTLDHRRNTVTGSTQFAKILRRPLEPSGMPLQEFLNELLHPEDVDLVTRVLAAQPPHYAFNARLLFPNGEITWMDVIGTIHRDTEGNVTRWEGTVQDVTERVRQEQEQEHLREKMQTAQKLESLGLLAGGVAHDFNNLLVGIMGNADLALLESQNPAATRQRLQDIVTTSQRAADLTNQLLAYSGKGRFVIQPTNLSSLVSEMGELLKISTSKNGSLQFFLEDDLKPVMADQTQVRQILMNLIINAAESIDHSNGLITITTGTVFCSEDFLQHANLSDQIPTGSYAYVEVKDNGIGMSPEVRGRLFEPFYTTKFSGRGLGMSAVLGIVRGHGGAIKITTAPGVGTSFKIFLPIADSPQEIVEISEKNEPFDGRQQRILIIDDDTMVSKLLQQTLENLHFEVIVAASGEEGLSLFRAAPKKFSLVLLDLTMPGIDGIETFTQLRELDPNVRTILMSGYNQQDATQHFVGNGLAGFLKKPFRISELSEIIGKLL